MFFEKNLTITKTKDLYNYPTKEYNKINNILNSYNLEPINLETKNSVFEYHKTKTEAGTNLATETTSNPLTESLENIHIIKETPSDEIKLSMKDELNNFLSQINNDPKKNMKETENNNLYS